MAVMRRTLLRKRECRELRTFWPSALHANCGLGRCPHARWRPTARHPPQSALTTKRSNGCKASGKRSCALRTRAMNATASPEPSPTATPTPTGTASTDPLANTVATTTVLSNVAVALSIFLPVLLICSIRIIEHCCCRCCGIRRGVVLETCENPTPAALQQLRACGSRPPWLVKQWVNTSAIRTAARSAIRHDGTDADTRQQLELALIDLGIAPVDPPAISIKRAIDSSMSELMRRYIARGDHVGPWSLPPVRGRDGISIDQAPSPLLYLCAQLVLLRVDQAFADAIAPLLVLPQPAAAGAPATANTAGAAAAFGPMRSATVAPAPRESAIKASEFIREQLAKPTPSALSSLLQKVPTNQQFNQAVFNNDLSGLPDIAAMDARVQPWWRDVAASYLADLLAANRCHDDLAARMITLGCVPANPLAELRTMIAAGAHKQFSALLDAVPLHIGSAWDPYSDICTQYVTASLSSDAAAAMLLALCNAKTHTVTLSPFGEFVRGLVNPTTAASQQQQAGGAAAGAASASVTAPAAQQQPSISTVLDALPKLPSNEAVRSAVAADDAAAIGKPPPFKDGAFLEWWKRVSAHTWDAAGDVITDLLQQGCPPLKAVAALIGHGWDVRASAVPLDKLVNGCVAALDANLLGELAKLHVEQAMKQDVWPSLAKVFASALTSHSHASQRDCIGVIEHLTTLASRATPPAVWLPNCGLVINEVLDATFDSDTPPDNEVFCVWLSVLERLPGRVDMDSLTHRLMLCFAGVIRSINRGIPAATLTQRVEHWVRLYNSFVAQGRMVRGTLVQPCRDWLQTLFVLPDIDSLQHWPAALDILKQEALTLLPREAGRGAWNLGTADIWKGALMQALEASDNRQRRHLTAWYQWVVNNNLADGPVAQFAAGAPAQPAAAGAAAGAAALPAADHAAVGHGFGDTVIGRAVTKVLAEGKALADVFAILSL